MSNDTKQQDVTPVAIQRWDDTMDAESGYPAMERDDAGQWVLFTDHAAVIAKLEAERDAIAQQNRLLTKEAKRYLQNWDQDRKRAEKAEASLAEVQKERDEALNQRNMTLDDLQRAETSLDRWKDIAANEAIENEQKYTALTACQKREAGLREIETLPCDVKVNATVFRKGVKLDTLIGALLRAATLNSEGA